MLTAQQANDAARSSLALAEMLSTPVVLVLLLLIFGSVRAALLPLSVCVCGVGGAFEVLVVAQRLTIVSVYAVNIITMLGLGLAVDYALLIVTRFRENTGSGMEVETAVRLSMRTAGRSVVFSGLVVTSILACLTIFPDTFLRSMGIAGASVVAIDMLASLTLLPILLRVLGKKLTASRQTDGHAFARLARRVQRRPVAVAVVVAATLLALALPALHLTVDAADSRSLPASATGRQYEQAQQRFFPTNDQPDAILVVALASENDATLARFVARVQAVPYVQHVDVHPLDATATALFVTPMGTSRLNQAGAAIAQVRSLVAPFVVRVGGSAAAVIDYEHDLRHRLPWVLAAMLLLAYVLLFAFTKSVVLPIKAVASSLLSIAASLGVTVWVFQDGHGAGLFGSQRLGALHLTVPVIAAAVALALSTDYEIFYLGRVREDWLATGDDRGSVARGLQQTGRVVTTAAVLIVSVFACFTVGGFAPISEIGLALSLAVLLDAFAVRLLLVPATMTVLGRFNWWAPSRRRGTSQPVPSMDTLVPQSSEPAVARGHPRV